MKVFDFLDLHCPVELFGTTGPCRILPDNSLTLFNFAKHANTDSNISILADKLKRLPVEFKYVFIDDSYDPVRLSDLQIQETIELVRQYFKKSHVIFLSSKCSHYFVHEKNVLWYPKWFLGEYSAVIQPRQKRIGCLNRRNAPHRIWLMHNLLSQNLIDHDRDIFSVAFADIYNPSNSRNIDSWLGLADKNYNKLIARYPDFITTVPDNFPNDMTTNHPAWHTAITIVTETECGELGMITEKTIKALSARCCWIAYTGSDCIRVLNNLGFDTQLFDQHANGINIDPILQACRTFDSESVAMDYYNSKLTQIIHNKQHLDHDWLDRYLVKLKQSLDLL